MSLRSVDAVARTGSIRKAAKSLSITSTALNRRILALEDELGAPLFDRFSTGVRLSEAGDLFIAHVRQQLADMERVQSQIADLAGERLGHVSVVCGQAMMNTFIPDMITRYRSDHPGVTFDVRVCNRDEVEGALSDYSADIALIFEPRMFSEFCCVLKVPQQTNVVFCKDHPLSERSSVRLSECAEYPMVLPTRANSVRFLLEEAAIRSEIKLPMVVESDNQVLLSQSLLEHNTVAFQIPIGLNKSGLTSDMVCRPLDIMDVPTGQLYLGYLKGRKLPVASSRFLALMAGYLKERFACF